MIGGLQGENGDLNIKYLKKINLKVSVANIWKHSGAFRRRTRWLWNFASWRSPFHSQRLISQPSSCDFAAKGWFRSLRNWPSAWCDRIPMALTSSFQLRFTYRLKHWIADFSSFKTTYSVHKLSSSKYSKSVQHFLSSWILHVRFLSLLSLLAFMICLLITTKKCYFVDLIIMVLSTFE